MFVKIYKIFVFLLFKIRPFWDLFIDLKGWPHTRRRSRLWRNRFWFPHLTVVFKAVAGGSRGKPWKELEGPGGLRRITGGTPLAILGSLGLLALSLAFPWTP